MSSAYVAGYIVGIVVFVVVFLVAWIIGKKVLRKGTEHYDERQILIRGKGYKISFMTTILINIFYSCFLYDLTKEIVSPQLVVLGTAFLGVAVYSIYCIFNDAYVEVGQNITKWLALVVFVIAANVVAAISNMDRGFKSTGIVTGYDINILVAVVFSVILVAMLIKLAIDKKEERA
ncbi:MAG: hypothetical protein K6A23_04540 [Butyrivibrio sp.]|nr:hypothetical protein [Butyrivibrio sp.]